MYKCIGIFTWKLSRTSIRYCIIFQQYTQYNDTTPCVNSSNIFNTVCMNFVSVTHINRQASEIACLTKTSHKFFRPQWFKFAFMILLLLLKAIIELRQIPYPDHKTKIRWFAVLIGYQQRGKWKEKKKKYFFHNFFFGFLYKWLKERQDKIKWK